MARRPTRTRRTLRAVRELLGGDQGPVPVRGDLTAAQAQAFEAMARREVRAALDRAEGGGNR